MNNDPLLILLPVGRIVQGNLYKGNDKDFDGKPRFYEAGHPKAGQPKVSWFFAVAIAKNPGETHWANTQWGQQIWAYGNSAWPQGQAQSPGFAWKIEDGDSQVPDKRGRKNCDREGFPGHWILNLNQFFAPRIYTRDSSGRACELVQEDAVKPGYYVQVQIGVATNNRPNNPGIYVNPNMTMLVGYGAEIRQGVDPNSVQWATGPLPAGASTTPIGGAMPATVPGVPAAASTPPAPAPAAAPPPPAATATPVVPSQTFIPPPAAAAALPPPAAPPATAAPPPPPAAPIGPQMTAKATHPYATYIAGGWTDAQLRQQGLMV